VGRWARRLAALRAADARLCRAWCAEWRTGGAPFRRRAFPPDEPSPTVCVPHFWRSASVALNLGRKHSQGGQRRGSARAGPFAFRRTKGGTTVQTTVSLEGHTTHRWPQRIAGVLRRVPWLTRLILRLVHWVQPRYSVGVVGVVTDARAERVLLVEHVYHHPYPWGLPGGWIKRGEDPAVTAEREIREETGLQVRAVRPLLIETSRDWKRHLTVVFLCQMAAEGQDIRLSHELIGYRWTQWDALPPMVRFHRRAVEAARAALAETDHREESGALH